MSEVGNLIGRIVKAEIMIDFYVNLIAGLCEKGHKNSHSVKGLLASLDAEIASHNTAVAELNALAA